MPASVTPSGSPGYIIASAPGAGAISPVYQPTSNEIFVFVIGQTGSTFTLYDCHLSGTEWVWESHGAPPGTTLYGTASSYGAMYDPTTDQVFFFLIAQDGHLWDRHGSGTTWEWYDHGVPASSPTLNFYPSPALQPTSGQIFAFVTAEDGHLYCNYWNGTEWQWTDQGTPPSTSAGLGVAAVCDPSSDHVYAFVAGGGSSGVGNLYVNQWNGTTWEWQDTGLAKALGSPGYFTANFPAPPNHQLNVLVTVEAPGTFPLAFGYLDKTKWVWTNIGMPT